MHTDLNEHKSEYSYSAHDHRMWQKLYAKQTHNLSDKACPTFLKNLQEFNLPKDKIPSIKEVNDRLYSKTGWLVKSVDGLISYNEYFSLLSNKIFPMAYFIRQSIEEDLSIDPDIFHELYGHCTMLLSHDYNVFLNEFAKFALTVSDIDRPLYARLIWFTTETGLLQCGDEIKIYGSSILSSYEESKYCLESNSVIRKPFDIISIFREPYRADLLQKVYYIMEDVDQIYSLLSNIPLLSKHMKTARTLGEFEPLFPVTDNKYANIGKCVPVEEYNIAHA